MDPLSAVEVKEEKTKKQPINTEKESYNLDLEEEKKKCDILYEKFVENKFLRHMYLHNMAPNHKHLKVHNLLYPHQVDYFIRVIKTYASKNRKNNLRLGYQISSVIDIDFVLLALLYLSDHYRSITLDLLMVNSYSETMDNCISIINDFLTTHNIQNVTIEKDWYHGGEKNKYDILLFLGDEHLGRLKTNGILINTDGFWHLLGNISFVKVTDSRFVNVPTKYDKFYEFDKENPEFPLFVFRKRFDEKFCCIC